MKVTAWRQGQPPVPIGSGTTLPPEAVIWCQLEEESVDAAIASRLLSDAGVEIPATFVARLFDDDHYPGVKYEEGEDNARSVVAFEACAIAGREVQLRVIEFLQYGRFLISRPQPCLFLRGLHDEDEHGERCDPESIDQAVTRRWLADQGSTSGDLGTVALYSLIKSLTEIRRSLHGWLDDTEMTLLRGHTVATLDDAGELIRLRAIIGALARRVRALKAPSARESDSWFFGRTTEARAKDTDEKLSRALDDFGRMADRLRVTVDLLQFQVAQKQQQAAERLQRRFELLTAVFVLPALVAAIYGANTELPGRGGWVGFAVMICLMALTALLGYIGFRILRHRT